MPSFSLIGNFSQLFDNLIKYPSFTPAILASIRKELVMADTVLYKFERIEKKFWINEKQYADLLPVLEANTVPDKHGESTICNIYYDTPDYALIRRSIERPLFKEKLRIRSYGVPRESDMVFVEIKRKLNGIGYKRRIKVPFGQAKKLLRGEVINCDNPQIEKELLDFIKRYRPQPMVYLSYRRYAMVDKHYPSLRVTIDRDLQYRLNDIEHLDAANMKPIMDNASTVLMEIKAPCAIPKWLIDEMSRLKIYQAPFSKVGTCYTRHIAKSISGIQNNISKGY